MSEERDPPPVDQPSDPPPQPQPDPPPPPPPAARSTETPWYKARIDELTAKLHRAQDELNQTKQAQTQSQPPANTNPQPVNPTAPPQPFDQGAFDRAVQAQADLRVAQDRFIASCTSCEARGRETFGATEFDGRVRALRSLVDQRDPDSNTRFNGMLNAAFETGADAEIVHELGGDLDRAMRLLSMPPMKMAVELERMATNLRSEAPPERQRDANGRFVAEASSNAPPPIRPVGSRGAQHTPISPDDPDRADGLDDREWIRRRNAQVADRQKQGVIIQ